MDLRPRMMREATVTPPKPEPVETAEHIVQMLAGEYLELNGFSVRQRDAMTKRIVARDAALVADAELKLLRQLWRICGNDMSERTEATLKRMIAKRTKGGSDGG